MCGFFYLATVIGKLGVTNFPIIWTWCVLNSFIIMCFCLADLGLDTFINIPFSEDHLPFQALVVQRVSKRCNHTITQLRKIFENLHKFWTQESETGKTLALIFIYLAQLDKVFLVSPVQGDLWEVTIVTLL